MKHLIYSFCLSLLIFGNALRSGAQPASGITIKKDIVYGHAGGRDLKLDIGSPDGIGPFPVILFFHGGGWQQGDKSHMHKWIRMYATLGYVGVSVGYRFAPQHKWPSQVHDAKTAVRYLRANAKELNIDTSRIAAMGESAGGYLALMLGVTSPTDGLEGEGGYADFSSSVKTVVSYFCATDFTQTSLKLSPELEAEMLKYYNKSLTEVRADFTGATSPDDPILKKISVLTYVDKSDAPVLMFHGDSDPFVSMEHAFKLQRAHEKAGVSNQVIIVKGGGHGWTGVPQEETTRQMTGYFERMLKNP